VCSDDLNEELEHVFSSMDHPSYVSITEEAFEQFKKDGYILKDSQPVTIIHPDDSKTTMGQSLP